MRGQTRTDFLRYGMNRRIGESMIVIATNRHDITSDLVVLELQRQGVPYLRFNSEDFLVRGGLSWTINRDGASGELEHRGEKVSLSKISAVWYRRPGKPEPSDKLNVDTFRRFARQEGEASLTNLWSLLDCFWVSHPQAILGASHKLLQLRKAAATGLIVPPTLLTMDPTLAQTFCSAHQDVVAKPLGRGVVEKLNGEKFIIYTNRLKSQDWDRLNDVAWTPTLFQKLIDKLYDLRVTIVGQSVFATEIHNAALDSEDVDWRRNSVEDLPHFPHVLPDELERRSLELVRGFGLQFAALDFVVDRDGQYIFLELNANGQWAWIEQLIGTPISTAMIELLRSAAPPL